MSDDPAPPAPPPVPAANPVRSPGALLQAVSHRVIAFLSSYALAIVLLLLLFVLTLLGTLEQGHSSLIDVQRKYFESAFLVYDIGPVSIPLPGASVVLALLAANLVVGGIVRLRKGRSTMGVLVTHAGILLLLGGSVVEFLASEKGQLTLREGSSSGEFRSYHEWEIVVRERLEGGRATEFVLPASRLERLDPDDVARFTSARLPFDVEVSQWMRNAAPKRAPGPEGVEGWTLEALDPEMKAEDNWPGARVTLRGPTSPPRTGLVFGAQTAPWVVTWGERRFEVDLRTRRWALPFRLELRKFVHEEHPGTSMPREFSSYVTKIEDDVRRDVHVTMNEPFRHRGYTFYQSSWGPPDAPPGTPLNSTFAVVRNPTDRAPLVACVVIAIGLLLHFGRKLLLHVRGQARGRTAVAGVS